LSFFTRSRPSDQERTTAPADGTAQAQDADGGKAAGRRSRRVVPSRVTTALACLFVLFVLTAPNELSRFTPAAFVRIPLEGLLGVALLLALPPRPGRVVAMLLGAVLGLLTIVKILDMGFFATLARPFDPILDWTLFDDAVAFLTDSVGRAGAVAAVVGVAVLVVALVVVMALAVRRLGRVVTGHRIPATGTVAALAVGWVACAVFGVQVVPGVPVAADSAAALAYDNARKVPAGLRDQDAFATALATDAFGGTPGDQLLTGLRGKDVILTFVESYGRDAIEDPAIAGQVTPVLADGDRRLAAAGFAARSGFLTSPTSGGGSWLAHSTLLSGLWIDSQQRYNTLVGSDRLTLTSAFKRADWRTVGVMPGLTQDWPEGRFYRYDTVYGDRDLGYRGPKFGWAPMPDQYTMQAFQRTEHGRPGRPPTMAEITLVSSHAPWSPIPQTIDWDKLGDGSVFGPMAKANDHLKEVWADPARVRTEYGRSVAYSVDTLVSWLQRYGDDRTVLVFLGDHQPIPLVTGDGADHDVPVTVVAKDPAVLDRISGWGWTDGLRPAPDAPVWRMDAFRDRFLTAFGPRR
jgi:hypothetical protein